VAVNLLLLNWQLKLQYRIYPLNHQLYDIQLVGNSSSSALAPTSVITAQVGIRLNAPTPPLTALVHASDTNFYHNIAVSRSMSTA
ncbi:porin, partial [Klebsiella quasipneumoniae]|nr:porin [Klebsiella quasipneumoniae]